MLSAQRQALTAALQWHIDIGADEALENAPRSMVRLSGDSVIEKSPAVLFQSAPSQPEERVLAGAHELKAKAIEAARAAGTLEELRTAIIAFEGLDIKRTATNIVFSEGDPAAPIMLVGEAPGTEEDRTGRPFAGDAGLLLDRILKTIGLDRTGHNPAAAIYISNILNWRPPGNRTPSPAELDISLPFIERHIALAQPRLLILCGGLAAKTLLGTGETISRLRGKWHDYTPLTSGITDKKTTIPTLVTYHPSYLLNMPAQKKAVWQDMLALQEKRRESGLF